jgi:hypothetical protein
MSCYVIRPDENGYTIVARYDDGTEEAHVSGLTREQAERTLILAGQEVRYEDRQLKLDL